MTARYQSTAGLTLETSTSAQIPHSGMFALSLTLSVGNVFGFPNATIEVSATFDTTASLTAASILNIWARRSGPVSDALGPTPTTASFGGIYLGSIQPSGEKSQVLVGDIPLPPLGKFVLYLDNRTFCAISTSASVKLTPFSLVDS